MIHTKLKEPLSFQARDTTSKLGSFTQVVFEIADVNEAPRCTILSTSYTNIPVYQPVVTNVLEFSCTDNDVVEAFKTLTYSLLTTGKCYICNQFSFKMKSCR